VVNQLRLVTAEDAAGSMMRADDVECGAGSRVCHSIRQLDGRAASMRACRSADVAKMRVEVTMLHLVTTVRACTVDRLRHIAQCVQHGNELVHRLVTRRAVHLLHDTLLAEHDIVVGAACMGQSIAEDVWRASLVRLAPHKLDDAVVLACVNHKVSSHNCCTHKGWWKENECAVGKMREKGWNLLWKSSRVVRSWTRVTLERQRLRKND
jgi:hypothetical protein